MVGISKLPRFSWNQGSYLNNTGFLIADAQYSLLALLQSRVVWFATSQVAQPLRLRAGLWQYRVIPQFVERLPIPPLFAAQETNLAELAEHITILARERYALHEALRRRISTDLGGGGKLNNALEVWWDLDFPTMRTEVKRTFKADIPLSERGDWEKYLADQQSRHATLTNQIIDLEIRLNAIIYEAFKLTPDETALIEKSTKYPYGAV